MSVIEASVLPLHNSKHQQHWYGCNYWHKLNRSVILDTNSICVSSIVSVSFFHPVTSSFSRLGYARGRVRSALSCCIRCVHEQSRGDRLWLNWFVTFKRHLKNIRIGKCQQQVNQVLYLTPPLKERRHLYVYSQLYNCNMFEVRCDFRKNLCFEAEHSTRAGARCSSLYKTLRSSRKTEFLVQLDLVADSAQRLLRLRRSPTTNQFPAFHCNVQQLLENFIENNEEKNSMWLVRSHSEKICPLLQSTHCNSRHLPQCNTRRKPTTE